MSKSKDKRLVLPFQDTNQQDRPHAWLFDQKQFGYSTNKESGRPIVNENLCKALEQYVASLVIIRKGVFDNDKIDDRFLSKMFCTLLISSQAGILGSEIRHRLIETDSGDQDDDEESRLGDQDVDEDKTYTAEMELEKSIGTFQGRKSQKKSGSRNSFGKRISETGSGIVAKAKSIAGISIKTRAKVNHLEINYNALSDKFDLGNENSIIEALGHYMPNSYLSNPGFTNNNSKRYGIDLRLFKLAEVLDELLEECAADVNEFFNVDFEGLDFPNVEIANKVKGQIFEAKRDPARRDSLRDRYFKDFNHLAETLSLQYLRLKQLVNCHVKVIEQEYAGKTKRYLSTRRCESYNPKRLISYFKALKRYVDEFNPVRVVGNFALRNPEENKALKSLMDIDTSLWDILLQMFYNSHANAFVQFQLRFEDFKTYVNNSYSALHIACMHAEKASLQKDEESIEWCEELLSGKFENDQDKKNYIDAKERNTGDTPLLSLLKDCTEVWRQQMITTENDDGGTADINFEQRGNPYRQANDTTKAIVRLLIAKDANVDCTNAAGESPFKFAEENEMLENLLFMS